MNAASFLTCLGYYNFATGSTASLEGIYSLTSGTTGIFFNQLYSSGSHYINGQIYAPTVPLINVYGNKRINSGIFSGNHGLKVGYNHTGNFGIIMDIEYSGCLRPNNQRAMVLLSTAQNPSGFNSGFMVGITESNRLYFTTSGYSYTMEKELGIREYVYISLAEKQYISFGTYSFNDNKVYKQNITMPSKILDSSDIYLGNFLRVASSEPYTGFSGKINQVVLFNSPISDAGVGICSNCSLATGFNTGSTPFFFSGWFISGMTFSGVYDYAITGLVNVTGQITSNDGYVVNVITVSGQTGYFMTGRVAIPTFSGAVLQQARNYTVFNYDANILNALSSFSLYFNQSLASGDSIELYSYRSPNYNIGKRITGLSWPFETGNVQLIANGLNETLDVDYYISRNAIIGYALDDVLSYDILARTPIVTSYSGYWNDTSKLQMSGNAFFPPSPQYFENANFTGIVKITGLSGICTSNPFYPNFGYDIHVNGQKLISGMHYNVVSSGSNGFVVSLSGKLLPPLYLEGVYDVTGGGPIAISVIDDNELSFLPTYSGFLRTRLDITGNSNTINNLTGFDEQVWVNGIRMLRNLDYIKVNPCSLITGTFNPPVLDFIMYDSDGTNTMWNMQLPPTITGLSGNGLSSTPLVNWNGLPVQAGNIFEVYSSQLISSTAYGPFIYNGFLSSWQYSSYYDGYLTSQIGSGRLLIRFNANNMTSEWFQTTGFSILDTE